MTLGGFWDTFLSFVAHARPKIEDRWVPVAMICLQVQQTEDGNIESAPSADACILWPASVPMDQRRAILADLAARYEGTIIQTAYTTTDETTD